MSQFSCVIVLQWAIIFDNFRTVIKNAFETIFSRRRIKVPHVLYILQIHKSWTIQLFTSKKYSFSSGPGYSERKRPLYILTFLYDVPISASFQYTLLSFPCISSPLLSSLLGIGAFLDCLTGKYSRSQLAWCPQIERLPSVLTPLPQIPGQFSCPAS